MFVQQGILAGKFSYGTAAPFDEVGCLSYSNRHADRLFELVGRGYETKSTLVNALFGTVCFCRQRKSGISR